MGLFSRIVETVRDFFTGDSADPVSDITGDVVDQVTDSPSVEEVEESRTYDSFGYDSFAEGAEDLGIHSAHVHIAADGVDITYNTDEGLITESYDKISDFFDSRYDELVAEGIEVDVEDEYAKA